MKRFLDFVLVWAIIPFLSSAAGIALAMSGCPDWMIVLASIISVAVLYVVFRKNLDLEFAAKANGMILLVLMVIFTIMMVITSGSVEGTVMMNFCWLLAPLGLLIFFLLLVGKQAVIFLTGFLVYAMGWLLATILGKSKPRKLLIPGIVLLCCTGISTYMYVNRPAVRYGGHGFQYMHGFSSTDFKDYMVYAENSRLVTLDHEPSLRIESAEDMPILDGAEACYPLYAALAKAVYKDIDGIEKEWLESDPEKPLNGKIVTFSNTILGMDRLIMGGDHRDTYKYPDPVDIFFGAKPSMDQLEFAQEMDVELQITPIGQEAFVFFVEEDNPVEGLTSEQVKAIYHGDITNWQEVGGKNQKIRAFQRPNNSGSQTMMQYFMGDVSLKEPDTYETVDAMAGVIRRVAQYNNEAGAIGYSFRYFLEGLTQEKGVRMLAIDGVMPTIETIENGTYPLTTDLCAITRKKDPNPNVQKMLDFVLSEDGQEIVRRTGYGGVAE